MIITIDKIENISGPGAGVFSKAAKACNSTTTLSYSYLMSTGNQKQREESFLKENDHPKFNNTGVFPNSQGVLNIYKSKFHPNEAAIQDPGTDDEVDSKNDRKIGGSSFFKSISRDK